MIRMHINPFSSLSVAIENFNNNISQLMLGVVSKLRLCYVIKNPRKRTEITLKEIQVLPCMCYL
ncbi:hypothetical protein HanXRQr2_Chr07g0294361 [Helianthus annuus]|uniref:Uncharacterized protein n=1 Tax=Helianthus annuus TaxID=4232 RepID=A0A9K3NFR5_HELAN|nr:hypothetical protein HanXRQr2_Chr07g0294361 [Helianthus annuus]KAJ0904672.1 hypothetical protein HanPSC8_Chr07g0284991 [Helianthus annuus]